MFLKHTITASLGVMSLYFQAPGTLNCTVIVKYIMYANYHGQVVLIQTNLFDNFVLHYLNGIKILPAFKCVFEETIICQTCQEVSGIMSNTA